MTSSISGLSSGLDTARIIDQLMQLEAISQNRLRSQQSVQKTVLAALQALNTDTSLLAGKADSLAKPATWNTLKGTSSSSDVTVALGATAAASSLSVNILAVAANHQLGFTDAHLLTDVVVAGGGAATQAKFTAHDGTVTLLDTGGGTLQELVTAINGSTTTTGVTATAVGTGNGGYRLLVQSTATGAASDFTLTNADATPLLGGATVRAGADALIDLGAGITATSATNTFAELLPGVSVTLGASAKVGTTATVTVAQDSSGVKSSVKALVDQLNALLTKIDTQSASGTSTSTAGPLAGDANARGLRSSLLNSIFGSGTSSMASVGIQTDRTGKLVFDDAAFTAAYAADPAGVAAQFTTGATPAENGWAARLQAVAKTASDPTTGSITGAITGRQSTIDRLGDNIDAWDLRLELRRTSLTRQYTALETALNSLQSQGNWLAGQLNALNNSSP